MASRYNKRNKKQIELVPALTTVIVIFVVLFIAVDVSLTDNATGPKGDTFLLRIQLDSEIHTNLNGTLTFEKVDGIYERIAIGNELGFVFTEKYYRGEYKLSFDGLGVSFGPIAITVYNVGTVYKGVINDITIKIDSVEG